MGSLVEGSPEEEGILEEVEGIQVEERITLAALGILMVVEDILVVVEGNLEVVVGILEDLRHDAQQL